MHLVAQLPPQGEIFVNERDSLFNKQWEQDSNVVVAFDKTAYWVDMENVQHRSIMDDTLLTLDYAFYNPLYRANPFTMDLGYLGSQSSSFYFDHERALNFNYGNEVYQKIFKKPETLTFIKSKNAFTDLEFSQASQSDLRMHGIFSKTYRNTTLFLDYQRIAHKPTDPVNINTNAVYTLAATEMDALQASFGYLPEKGRYHAFFNYIFNQSLQNDNGGYFRSSIQDSLLKLGPDAEDNFLLASNLTDANTRFTEFTFDYLHELALNQPDSSSSTNTISHRISYQQRTQAHFNRNFPRDSFYYNTLLTDDRGVRSYFKGGQLENRLVLKRTGNLNPLNQYEIGLVHQLIRYEYAPLQFNENYVWAIAKFNTIWKDRFNVAADIKLGLTGDRSETYALNGKINWRIGDYLHLAGTIQQQRRAASVIENTYVNAFNTVWNQSLDKEFSTKLGFEMFFEKTASKIEISTQNILNYIYFDTLAQARQTSAAQNIFQLKASQHLTFFRNIHLQAQGFYQVFTDAGLIPLPVWGINADLYYQNSIINDRLDMQIGVNMNMYDTFSPYAFHGAFDQFYLQRNYTNPTYPLVAAYLNLRRESFRGFVRVENILTFTTEDVFQPVDKYLLRDFYLRFGIAWRLHR